MVRRIPIRVKVAGALAVPLIGLVVAVIIGAAANAASARNVGRQADLATASIGHAGLIGALQNERNIALLEMLGLTDALDLEVDDSEAARAITDRASTELHHSLDDQSGALRDDYSAALRTLVDLADLRDRVDAADGSPAPGDTAVVAHDVFGAYTTIISTLFASHDRFALEVDDSGLRQGDDLVHNASHASDAAAQLADRLIHLGGTPGSVDEPAEVAQVVELRRDLDRYNRAIEVKGTGPYAAVVDELLDNPRVTELSELARFVAIGRQPVDPVLVLDATPLGPDGGYQTFRDDVVVLLDDRADDLHAAAQARLRLLVGGGLATVLGAVGVAWWISRSITRPLRDLSLTARSIATYRLPAAVQDILAAPPGEDLMLPEAEPVTVRSRDEVADVAGAFNLVQEAAIALATEQAALRRNVAESYVNLGRRNQNLLSRLLQVVGDLERDENDTERLTRLYRLDHLATRIRRNAESLLVLSQAAPVAPWKPPVALADVVRAALGEIENYERVLVRTLDSAMVIGNASSDLAHLLAELVENGLRHSPPRELVEVSGRNTPDGYTLMIVDHGLGMTPDELDRANQRLAGEESYAVTPAKYLGHYVTAVLAARHGIRVRLQGSVVVGIAARVDLPNALIVEHADLLALPPAGNGSRPVQTGPTPAYRGAPAGSPTPPSAPARAIEPAERPLVAPFDLRSGPARRMPGWARPVAELPGFQGPRLVTSVNTTGDAVPAPPAGTDQPERTASGLIRRVPGAHVPPGAASARTQPAGTATAGTASSGTVDGAEIQRFLTSLVGGVQRSIDKQSPTNGAEAGGDDAD